MKTMFFDCFAGASGDMILGALIDVGAPLEPIEAELRHLSFSDLRLHVKRVDRQGVSATRVHVHGGSSRPDGLRWLLEYLALLDRSRLSPRVRQTARRVLLRLGQAASRAHGTPLDETDLQQAGGAAALVDIVAAAAALHAMDAQRIVVSPVPVGRMSATRGAAPVPAPVTAYLLEGAPVYSSDLPGDLITPAGAAILTEVATAYGAMPALTVERIGYGAGARDRETPNVLRLVVGEGSLGRALEPVTELVANVEDMNPQLYEHLSDRLLQMGALDVWMVPAFLKKSRPGMVLHVLAAPETARRMAAVILAESTAPGVRFTQADSLALTHTHQEVGTPWGPVRVNLGQDGGHVLNRSPEYEDCRALARAHGVPLKDVLAEARAAARENN